MRSYAQPLQLICIFFCHGAKGAQTLPTPPPQFQTDESPIIIGYFLLFCRHIGNSSSLVAKISTINIVLCQWIRFPGVPQGSTLTVVSPGQPNYAIGQVKSYV